MLSLAYLEDVSAQVSMETISGAPSKCFHSQMTVQQLLQAEVNLDFVECLVSDKQAALAFLLLQRHEAVQGPSDRSQSIAAQIEVTLTPQAPVTAESSSSASVWWIALKAGNDSNINRGNSATAVNIPLLNYRKFDLPDLLVKRSSNFLDASFGGDAAWSFDSICKVELSGEASVRWNASEQSYLPYDYTGAARLSRAFGTLNAGIARIVTQQWLSGYTLLERTALRGQVGGTLSRRFSGEVLVEAGDNGYPWFDGLTTNDQSIEFGVRYTPANMRMATYGGHERGKGQIKDLDHDFDGIRFTWRSEWRTQFQVQVTASTGNSRYLQFSKLFNTSRTDKQTAISISVPVSSGNRRIEWKFIPAVQFEDVQSNIALYSFSRMQFSLQMRREFD